MRFAPQASMLGKPRYGINEMVIYPKALFTAQVPVLDEFKLKPKFAF